MFLLQLKSSLKFHNIQVVAFHSFYYSRVSKLTTNFTSHEKIKRPIQLKHRTDCSQTEGERLSEVTASLRYGRSGVDPNLPKFRIVFQNKSIFGLIRGISVNLGSESYTANGQMPRSFTSLFRSFGKKSNRTREQMMILERNRSSKKFV